MNHSLSATMAANFVKQFVIAGHEEQALESLTGILQQFTAETIAAIQASNPSQ